MPPVRGETILGVNACDSMDILNVNYCVGSVNASASPCRTEVLFGLFFATATYLAPDLKAKKLAQLFKRADVVLLKPPCRGRPEESR